MSETTYTPSPPAPDEDVPDFSKPRKRVAFKIDNDVFEAPPAIPAMILMDYAKRFNGVNTETEDPDAQMKIMTDLLKVILRPASYERFYSRLSDPEEPIELDQIQTSIEYLMGKYGLRPTQPPSNSAPGQESPDAGMSLTGNTPVVVSTSGDLI